MQDELAAIAKVIESLLENQQQLLEQVRKLNETLAIIADCLAGVR